MATSKRKPKSKRKAAARKPPARKRAPKLRERQQPESLRLRGIAPSFTVNNIARSLAFYTDVLGFLVEERWEEEGRLVGATLKAGDCRLMIGQDDFAKGRDRPKGEGHRIWCRTIQDIDALAARVRARGGTMDSGPSDTAWGTRQIALTDPDGFRITIFRE